MCLIQLLEPRYTGLTPLTDSPPSLGSVLVAQLENRVNRLAEALRAHRRLPWCPVCVVLTPARIAEPHLPDFEPYPGAFATVIAPSGGSLPKPEQIVAAIRHRPLPTATTLGAWVAARTGHAEFGALIESACATDPASQASRGSSDRSLRLRSSQWHFPRPRQWRMLLELIERLGDPKRDLTRPIDWVAGEVGWETPQLRRRIRRCTGARPAAAITWATWEWAPESALRAGGLLDCDGGATFSNQVVS